TADSGQPNNAQTKPGTPSVQPAQSGTDSKAITADSGQPNNAQNKQSNVDLSLWKWQTADSTKGYNGIKLTGYTGDVDENATIYVPNNVDFIKAGKIKAGQSVYLDDLSDIRNCRRLIIDNHDGGKVIFVRNPTGSIPTFTSETLEYIDVSGADTHLLTDMSRMFYESPNLKRIVGLENFDTSHVQSFELMFGLAPQLMDIGDLSKWDVSKVENFNEMFQWDKNLTNIGNLDNWDVSQAKSFEMMFMGTKNLESIGSLKDWQVKNVTDMGGMFLLSSIVGVDMSNWDVSSLRDASYMFAYNYNPRFTNLELPNFSKAKLGNWLQAFLDDNYLENINISGWDFVDDLMPIDSVTYVHYNKYFHDADDGADNLFDKWLSTSGVNGLTVNTIGAKWPSDLDLMPKNSDFDYNPKYGVTDNGINRFSSFEGLEEYTKDIKYSEKPTPLVVLTDNQTLLGYNKQRSESNRPNEITLVDKNGKVIGQYQMPIFYTSIDDIKKQIGQYEDEFTQNYCKQNNDPKATFTFTLVDPETHQELTEKQIENLTPAQLVMATYLVRQNAKATVTPVEDTTVTYTFYDETDKKLVEGHDVTVTGQPGTDQKVNLTTPEGYKLAEGQTLPTSVMMPKANETITINLVHATKDIKPNDPGVNPSDPVYADMFKTVTRTIKVNNPDRMVDTTTQQVNFNRTKTIDEVTDEVISYGNWTLATGSAKDWGQFNVPQLDGFISYVDGNAAKEVAEENVTADTADVTVEVTYKNSDNNGNNTNPGDDGNHNTNPGNNNGINNGTQNGNGNKTVNTNVTDNGNGDKTVNTNVTDNGNGDKTVNTNVTDNGNGDKTVNTNVTDNGNGDKTVNTNVTDNGNGDNSQNNKQALPQTGNTKNDAAVAGLGLAGLLAMLGLGGLKKKRN
ncbi:BspA family leucine-rich repeat surface protein, partial [Limosilactobacillus reuteri]